MQYCFEDNNSSCLKEVRSPAVYVVMYISAVAVVMLTVCGNLVVIISISHFKQLHTPTNFLLLSLAVADFLVGTTVLPFCLILLIETCWFFGEMYCILYNIIGCIIAVVSVYNVVCIAIDRYFAVCDPLLYSTKVTVNITWSLILFTWFFGVLYNLALVYFNGNINGSDKTNICFGQCRFLISETWGIADVVFVFILPCTVILLLYGKIFIVARRHAKVTDGDGGPPAPTKITTTTKRHQLDHHPAAAWCPAGHRGRRTPRIGNHQPAPEDGDGAVRKGPRQVGAHHAVWGCEGKTLLLPCPDPQGLYPGVGLVAADDPFRNQYLKSPGHRISKYSPPKNVKPERALHPACCGKGWPQPGLISSLPHRGQTLPGPHRHRFNHHPAAAWCPAGHRGSRTPRALTVHFGAARVKHPFYLAPVREDLVMLTVCGNLVVIISISHFKQLHTPTNFLMLSLAVADFLVGAAVMPFYLILFIETCWYFGETFCILYNVSVFFLTSVSVSNVACIAIDRYFAVCYPLLYSAKVTDDITASVILLNWLLSLLYNLAFMYFNGNMSGAEKLKICLGDCMLFISKSWVIIDLLCTLILPCSIMITLYFKIFVVARKHARAISSVTEQMRSADGANNNISTKSERKAAKTLGILVIVFLLCLVPYYICSLALENVDRSSLVLRFLDFVEILLLPLSAERICSVTELIARACFRATMKILKYSAIIKEQGKINVNIKSIITQLLVVKSIQSPRQMFKSCWYFGEMFCILYNTIGYIVVCVPVYNVVCIAIDRYFAVCDPLLYSTKVTVSIARSLILFVWLFAILYNLVLIYFNGNFTGTEKTNDCLGNCLIVMSETWGVADIIIVFILPCSVIVLVYGKVFVVARRNAKVIGLVKEKNHPFDKRKNVISKKSERKSARTLGIVIVAFLMSLMPYFMCSFSYSDGTLSADASSVLSNFRSWLLYFNSFLNPIIYVLFYPWFQKTVKHIVTLRIFYIASSLINLFPESR
ncbi:TAAR3 protein, partial [Atractosteus spatula]|nr:TAAR3 protein [Atractosteus spatula]